MNTVVATAERSWSPYQQALFNWAANGQGNIIVNAVAGSGKTTTGVEMTRRMRGSHIYLAFNRAIAAELSGRGVNGCTFHRLCHGPVLKALNLRAVEPNKLHILVRDNYAESIERDYGTFIKRMVGLARNAGIGAGLLANETENWMDLARHHDLEPDAEGATVAEGIQHAMRLLELSNADEEMVDFDDLLYFAVRNSIALPKFQNVLVDEAQDTNAIQRAIVRKIMLPTSRLAAVGDPAQAIYGFRGADSDSLALLAREFGCVGMPLTVTYRCPTSVVNYVHQWVEHIEAAPSAKAGLVKNLHDDWDNSMFQPQDLVVCRTTKPLVALAYRLIRDHIPARVMGREIGQGLKSLVNRMKAKGIDALIDKLQVFTARECAKARAQKNESKVEAIQDRTDCVMCIIEGLSENDRTIPALLSTIDQLFSDAATNGVVLATIHKSKGLEAERVFWLNRSKCPASWVTQEWQREQERNLCYVAATRAKSELYLIEEER